MREGPVSSVVVALVCLLPPVVASNPVAQGPAPSSREAEGLIFTRADIELYVDEWSRLDGAAGFFVSDWFRDAFPARHDVFLAVMEDHPVAFRTWVATLDPFLFTDYGTCCSDPECERLELLAAAERVQPAAPAQGEMVRSLAQKLGEIRIRRIE